MSNLNWFYSQRWAQKKWEKLLETRTIKVIWDSSEEVTSLPEKVKLPDDLDLTDKAISNYLSEEYGHTFLNWMISE